MARSAWAGAELAPKLTMLELPHYAMHTPLLPRLRLNHLHLL